MLSHLSVILEANSEIQELRTIKITKTSALAITTFNRRQCSSKDMLNTQAFSENELSGLTILPIWKGENQAPLGVFHNFTFFVRCSEGVVSMNASTPSNALLPSEGT